MIRESTTSPWTWLGPLVLFTIVSLPLVGAHIFPMGQVSTFSYDSEDFAIFLWDFWWTNESVLRRHNPYWTELLFHPTGTSLSFHSYPLLHSVLSIPLQRVLPGMQGLVVAYNCAILLSFILAALGMYRLAMYETRHTFASLLAGLIFAFMPFHFLHMARLHLLAVELLPFYVLAVLRLFDRPSVREALTVSAWMAVTYYTSLEYALQLAIFSILLLGYRGFTRRRDLSRWLLATLGIATAGFLLLVAPLLLQQMASGAPALAERSLEEAASLSPPLASLVTPSRRHPVYGEAFAFAGEWSEGGGMRSDTAIGTVALLLALVAAFKRRRDGRMFWVLAGGLFLFLLLGPYLRVTEAWETRLPMPYLLAYKLIPPLRASRDPARFFPIMMLMLGVLGAFCTRDLMRNRREGTKRLVMVALTGLVMFDSCTGSASKYDLEVHPAYRLIAMVPGEFAILDLTSPQRFRLLAQMVHGKALTNTATIVPRSPAANTLLQAESDFQSPDQFFGLDPEARSSRLAALRGELALNSIRYIVFSTVSGVSPRAELARLLGARIQEMQGLVVCDLSEIEA
jgi:hypothetical protein